MDKMIKYMYVSNANAILDEIAESLSPAEKQELKKYLSGLSKKQISDLTDKFRNDVFYYIRAKPEQRKSDARWNKPDNKMYKPLTAYFSFIYMQRTCYILKKLRKLPAENGIREMLAAIAVTINDVLTKDFKDTIFDDILTFEDF